MKNQMITVAAVLAMGTSLAFASPQTSTAPASTSTQAPQAAAAPQSATASPSTPAVSGTGQESRGPGQRMMDRSAETLNLTDAQKLQMQQLRDQYQKDNGDFIQKFRQNMSDLRKAQQAGDTRQVSVLQPIVDKDRPQMDKLRADMETKFMAILTPDQQKQYQAMKAQRQMMMQNQAPKPATQPQAAPQPQHQ